jgi:adenine phosphoribosyltransferase
MQFDLKEYIRDVHDFPIAGIVFKDISPLLGNHGALTETVTRIGDRWGGKIDAVAALDARGFIFGGMLAFKLGLPLVMLRKKGKLPGATIEVAYGLEYGTAVLEVQADTFDPGARVLLVDDLLATGGTAAAGCALIEKSGAIVAGCAFVIELAELGGRKALLGREVQTLVSYEEISEPITCADVIARYEEKFVLIERLSSVPGLAFPGGKQESGERLSATAIREFAEETGLVFVIEGVLGTYAEPDRDPRGAYVSTVFIGTASGTPRAENGKTRVILLNEEEMIASKGLFVFDHAVMMQDFLSGQ